MAKEADWQFPVEMRPRPEDWRFDLDGALDAVVQLRAEIPEDAFTAQILGTERVGNGVVIRDDGLVVTIGYLITEASTIWLTTNKGTVVPAFPLGYDQTTGFGLVQPLGKLGLRPLVRGSAVSCRIGENVVVADPGDLGKFAGSVTLTEPGTYTVTAWGVIQFGEVGGCGAQCGCEPHDGA